MAEKDYFEFAEAMANLHMDCHVKHKTGCLAPDCRECIRRSFSNSWSHLLPETVKHGKWIYGCVCSVCGDAHGPKNAKHAPYYNYCPNCGAKMEGERISDDED